MPRTLLATAVLLLLIGITGAAGCGGAKTSDKDLDFIEVTSAESMIRKSRHGAVYLDPRSDRAYAEGHIPGAIHLPLERVDAEHRTLDRKSVIIVYGNTERDPVTLATSKLLIELGYDVRTLRGGLRAWEATGQELEKN